MNTRTLAGPMVWLTFLIAALWAGLGVGCFWAFPGWIGIAFAVAGALGAVLTGWLAASMVVRYGAFALKLPGRGEVPWEEVADVAVVPAGLVTIPAVSIRSGRALEEIQLGGLAWFGRGVPLRLAQKLAEAGDRGEVTVRGGTTAQGRRAAD